MKWRIKFNLICMPLKRKFGDINFIGIGIRTPLACIDFGNGFTLDMVLVKRSG